MRDTLHLMRIELSLEALQRHAQRRHHAPEDDLGYATHSVLCELFGELAPGASFVRTHARAAEVLAYTAHSAQALEAHALQFADPGVYRVAIWDTLASKPMPSTWPARHRLGFDVRVCPVVRGARDETTRNPKREVDAFIAASARVGTDVILERQTIYCDWLKSRLEREGACELVQAEMSAFSIQRLARQTQGDNRRFRTLARPDAHLRGTLTITDSAGFNALLLRGVGRHCSFGFGMLRLKPC
jgi:CRISPR system Cascade subunit CasE